MKKAENSLPYFEFSWRIVDKEGLNIRSRSVSMNVLEPVCEHKNHW